MGPSYRTSTYQTQKQQEQPPDNLDVRVLSPRHSAIAVNLAISRQRRPHGRSRATKVIAGGIATLCLLLYFLHVNSRVEELHTHQLLHERDGQPLDVVAVSLKPSCVTRHAVASLNAHLRPRTIHIVTTGRDKCALFTTFASNVVCHLQDEFLPGLTATRVGDFLQRRLGLDQHHHFMGRELAGWYMQQLVKLSSVLALPNLSEYYLIWDLDMVLLAPVQLLWRPGDLPNGGAVAAAASGGGAAGQVQTLVNIGGSVSLGYMASFQRLFKRNLEFAPDGSSFVTHWMVIYKPYLREFLSELAAGPGSRSESGFGSGGGGGKGSDGGGGGPAEEGVLQQQLQQQRGAAEELDWVWRILGSVDARTAELGFSEYASYISWVRQHYPQSQRLAPRKTWVRHPFGQGAVKLLRLLRSDRCCCPSGALLRLLRALGFSYTGFEVGHIAACRYDAAEHATSYGL